MVGNLCGLGGLLLVAVTRFADCAGSRAEGRPLPSFQDRGKNTEVSQDELDACAVAACQWLWDNVPEAKRWEYCGVLYLDEAGGIRVGLPERGRLAYSCWPNPPQSVVLLGRYHNHRFEAEPSRGDREIAKAEPLLGTYLCGPSGIVRRISAKEGTVNVGTVNVR